MCIALPMKVLESGPMMIVCERNGRRLEVDCSMIDPPAVGAWLLVFQNRALREIEEQRPEKLKPLSAQRLASWRATLTKRQSARGLAI